MRRLITVFILVCAVLAVCAACAPAASAPESPVPVAVTTPEPTPQPVVFSDRTVHSVREVSLKLVANAEDFALLDRFEILESVDFTGSECYAEIAAWAAARPDTDVRYAVPIGDAVIDSAASQATVSAVPEPALLAFLPRLKTLTLTEPLRVSKCAAIRAVRDDLELRCTLSIAGMLTPYDTEELDVSAASPDTFKELLSAVSLLPNLRLIRLPAGLSLDQADSIRRAKDGLAADYPTEAFGVSFSLADEVVSFNGVDLSNRLDEVRTLLPYLSGIGRVDMEDCGISNEDMAALRDAFPTPKLVWRLHLRTYTCRTDAIMVRFSNNMPEQKLHDEEAQLLRYCNEMRYLDLGHNLIEKPSFVQYMPDLEVCIVAVGAMTDITGIEHCKKLEYCEFMAGHLRDVSPLAACTELRHLNVAFNEIGDISPLYGLTKLERLWISHNPIPQEQIDRIRALLPDCEINTTADDPSYEGWRFTPDNIVPRYRLLRLQFCYDELDIRTYTAETKPDFVPD